MLTLRKAVEIAIDEMRRISAGDPQEVLPKEFQLAAAMYRAYFEQGYRVHLEAGYTRCENFGPECDLRIGQHNGDPERWIEIKRLWKAAGFVGKVPDLVSSVQEDLKKLRDWAPLGARKFAVAFLFTGDQKKQSHNLQDSLRAISDAKICFEIPPEHFGWRGSKISEMSAIAWQLPEERLPE